MEGQKKLNQRGRRAPRGGGRESRVLRRESRVLRPGADAAVTPPAGFRAGLEVVSQQQRWTLLLKVRGKQARFMTQEFKEQNAMMVDGRLLCRHFLWGRCIKARGFCRRSDRSRCRSDLWDGNAGILKAPVCSWLQGDGCQLEHVQGHNDLIKELCKFYVQGFCSKGHDCPYMHHILSAEAASARSPLPW